MADPYLQTTLSSENEISEEASSDKESSEEVFSKEESSDEESSEKESSEEEYSEKYGKEESSEEYVEEESSEEYVEEESSEAEFSEECAEEESPENNAEEGLESFRKLFPSQRLTDLETEDVMVFLLYLKEVREIEETYDIGITERNEAYFSMIRTITEGHKHSFYGFSGLDFNQPKNRCAYLLRYAATHTGLVRKAMWNIFRRDLLSVDRLKTKDELNIVSLGGGPGNDILGFCSALQEFPSFVTSFHFIVVDIKEGWSGVLDSLIRKSKSPMFESLSFSKIVKDASISSNFILADLTDDGLLKNENLTGALDDAHVVLMVKLTSFHPTTKKSQIIMNVCKAMRSGCVLVFIDCPYPRECFESVSCVIKIYEEKMKYHFDSSSLASSGILNIKRSQATVAVFIKV